MSKAAASLATVSDYGDEDCTYGARYSGGVQDWDGSPDWNQASYSLSSVPDISRDTELYVTDRSYTLKQAEEITPIEEASEPSGREHLEVGTKINKIIPAVPSSIPVTATEISRAPVKDSSASSPNVPLPTGPTQIILERGFDSLPALCYVAERCAKTICVYNYPGSVMTTMNIEAMLKKNTKLPVVMPESAKQERLIAATKKFNLAPSSILVWPGSKKLPKITGLSESPNIQLVHIGEPSQINAGITCLKSILILAKSNLGQPQGSTHKDIPLDVSNNICNKQGLGSPLEEYRLWLRSRFSQNTCARGIYWDWILQRRKYEPKLGAVEIVRLANRFSEEFLLRGQSKEYGEPVGGQVTVAEPLLKGYGMEPAVKAGLLLVS
ncbi:unnamed protein product [Rhizoctonia solani]|uniref:Uncharacterized protein n=1 Tax=Rhizoctonia solani TaxID=456999 RepID=A0A8H3HX57_9AGAM|nr:unnamed protein product [Rhizoctonia solani]